MAQTDERIKDNLESLLSGSLSLRDFQLWFADATWDAEPNDLVDEIDLRVAEYLNGHLVEQELRRHLWRELL